MDLHVCRGFRRARCRGSRVFVASFTMRVDLERRRLVTVAIPCRRSGGLSLVGLDIGCGPATFARRAAARLPR
jgi:hypothetical protein